MYKPYTIHKVNKSYLVISSDFSRIEDYMSSLNNELLAMEFEGEVVFDLLLSNGNNSSRFYAAYFDGMKIVSNSYFKVKELDAKIAQTSMNHFSVNPELLFNGVLTEREVERFLASNLIRC